MTQIPDEVVERMVAVLRTSVARADEIAKNSVVSPNESENLVEARAILALLPEPVDPDEAEAELIIDGLAAQGYVFANTKQARTIALASIKRGRELERAERAKGGAL